MATHYYERFCEKGGKDFETNLRLRAQILERAAKDFTFRKTLLEACREDTLFFFNAFCWLYEPRPRRVNGKKLPNIIPFITWEHQDPVILQARESIGYEDIGIEKSRGEGASWMFILLALQDWLFEPMSAIGFISRTELAVDNPDDPDSLFWKADWELEKLPSWMAGERTGVGDKAKDYTRNVSKHILKNNRNGSQIVGYSATGDVTTGGRKFWILFDELAKFPRPQDTEAMASTQHVTESRILISTPKGAEGEYYKMMHTPSNMVKLILDWKDNEHRNPGLYKLSHGKPVAQDPNNNPLPKAYDPPDADTLALFSRLRSRGCKLENKARSPWYDKQCDRPGATPQSIAQELDRDYGGSVYRIMGPGFFSKAKETVLPFRYEGSITYDRSTMNMSFQEAKNGPIKVWCHLDHTKRPPMRPYAVAADISSGLGGTHTSNSAIQVIDLISMEQVMEYTTNVVEPSEFGEHAVAICKWFHDAYLSWEINFGGGFGKRVRELNYPNLFMRTVWTKRGKRKTKDIGWHTNKDSKEAAFADYIRMVTQGEIKVRSEALRQESGEYVRINGKIEHLTAFKSPDDTNKGEAHGDRVMAFVVAIQAAIDRPAGRSLTLNEESINVGLIPPYTMAARMAEWDSKKATDEWDDKEVGRLTGRWG